MSDCIYLDYNASTPLEPRVLSAMQDIYSQTQVNAGSITHSLGRNAQAVVEEARAAVANSIQAEARDIVFCGGATEGINLALIGMARQYQSEGKHIICSSIEHRAVLAVLDQLETEGFEVSRLPVDKMGYVDPDVLKSAIRADTIICALIHVNNEIGTVQNLSAIAEHCRSHDVRLFVDAAQSWGKIAINVQETPIDALVCSAHKAYGPQGIGALYLRRKPRRVRLQPCFYGGGQERGMRPGTLPVALVHAMGVTARINQEQMAEDQAHAQALRKQAIEALSDYVPGAVINGDVNGVLANTLNFQIPGRDAQDLLCSLPECALAMGSACSSSVPQPSHVLRAIGLSWQEASSSIRMSFGRMSTKDEIKSCMRLLASRIPDAALVAEE